MLHHWTPTALTPTPARQSAPSTCSMMVRSASAHKSRGACRESGHCPNSCPPASTTAFMRPCPFLARRLLTPVKFQLSPPDVRSIFTLASRSYSILPQEAFGLCGRNRFATALPVCPRPDALSRLSQPVTKSTRTALHHPHHGGDKTGATLAKHTLKELLEMALLNSKSPQAFVADRATVVPLRSHQRPLACWPPFLHKQGPRSPRIPSLQTQQSRQFVKSYG